MKKFEIIATRDLQIEGVEDNVAPGGTVLGTIVTNCCPMTLLSCLQQGNARLVTDEDEAETPKPKTTKKPKAD